MEGWKLKPLGEVCNVIGGGTPSKANPAFYVGDIPWATVRDMTAEVLSETEFKISKQAVIKSSTNVIPSNNVIIATRVGLGKVCLLAQDTAINQDLRGIIPKNPRKLDVCFLLRWFQSIANLIEDEGTGFTVKGVKLPFVKALKVPILPLPEQKRIVAILDEAFEGIGAAVANAEKNLASARELFESHLKSVFTQKGEGWVEKKLGDVCGISTKLIDPREPENIDLPHIGAGNMESKTGVLVDVKTSREEGLKSGKFLFEGTMVLYSKIRPYLEKACRPDFKGLCSADVYPLTPNPAHMDRDYLFYMLLCRDFTDYAIQGSARAGMPKVNRAHLFKYVAWFPSVHKQAELASQLDALAAETQRLETNYNQKLDSLAELKQSILQKAFSGELSLPTPEVFSIASSTIAADTTSAAFVANVLAYAYHRHALNKREKTFGHVKAQKTLHLTESIGGIDLGREPMRDAAGPTYTRPVSGSTRVTNNGSACATAGATPRPRR